MQRIFAAVVLAIGIVAMNAPAGAAARLLVATPENGASLQTLEKVTFEFDVLLLPDDAEILLIRRNGELVAEADVEVDGAMLIGRFSDEQTSGDYEVVYSVFSADGALNEGSIRVDIAAPAQALSGGLLAVIGVFVALVLLMTIVFLADKRRRRPDRRRQARHA